MCLGIEKKKEYVWKIKWARENNNQELKIKIKIEVIRRFVLSGEFDTLFDVQESNVSMIHCLRYLRLNQMFKSY